MTKWLCACGTTIRSSGNIPNETEVLLISDQDFEAFWGPVDPAGLYRAMTHAFRCPACDRLHVFWAGMRGQATIYAREGEGDY